MGTRVEVIRELTKVQEELKLKKGEPFYLYIEYLKILVLLGDVKIRRWCE